MINSFETGGSERQFVVLAKSFNRRAFHVLLDVFDGSARSPTVSGRFPNFLSGAACLARLASYSLALEPTLAEQQVLIAHAFDFYTSLTLVPAARFARVPVVVGSFRQIGDLLTPVNFHAQATVFRWCDAVVCNSHAAADRLAEHGVTGTSCS